MTRQPHLSESDSDVILDSDGVEDELRDFDPTKEGGGGPCKGCGVQMDPWRYADYCVPCSWDKAWER